MTDFDRALAFVLEREGGWVNNPNDKGGETYRGVARNYNLYWPGWNRIHRLSLSPIRRLFPHAIVTA